MRDIPLDDLIVEVSNLLKSTNIPGTSSRSRDAEIDETDLRDLADDVSRLHRNLMAATKELEEKIGPLAAELKSKKKQLLQRMIDENVEAMPANDGVVRVTISRSTSCTKKSITAVLGKEKADRLWSDLPVRTSHSLKID